MVKINKQGCRGKYGNAKTGIFKPQNREKYLSFETPIYKSKLELLFMRYLDKSQNVKWWKYEPNHIFYIDHSADFNHSQVIRRFNKDFAIVIV